MQMVAVVDIGHSIGVIPAGAEFTCYDPELQRKYLDAGQARPKIEPVSINARRWNGLLWDGATAVIIASGPSLTVEQCEAVRGWRHARSDGSRRVVVVNTSFRRAPWADALYAGDDRWWRAHFMEAAETCSGEFWALESTLHNLSRIRILKHQAMPGLGKRPGTIHEGGNSGYQAMNLAYQAGVVRMILLGFDCHAEGGAHWHGDHPIGLRTRGAYRHWIAALGRLATDLRAEGVEVVNCSPGTALDCFEKRRLEEALA